MSVEQLTSDDSVDLIVTRLNELFKKNETLEQFEILDNFQTYSRPHHVTINDFMIEFDKRLTKTKKIGTVHSDDFLAYRLIKSANLSEQDEKMVKATCKLTYQEVKDKLKSIFGDAGSKSISHKPVEVKAEVKSEVKSEGVYFTYGNSNNRGNQQFRGFSNRGSNNTRGGFSRGRGSRNRGGYNNRGRGNRGWRGASPNARSQRNPLDKDGNTTKCLICESVFHYASTCPHQEDTEQPNTNFNEKSTLHLTDEDNEESSLLTEQVVFMTCEVGVSENDVNEDPNSSNLFNENTTLHLVDEDKEESCEEIIFLEAEEVEREEEKEEGKKLGELLPETWNAALLDTGATKTVSGRVWVDNYVSCLPEKEQKEVQFNKCETAYRFGDGKRVTANESVKLPAKIGKLLLWVTTDIVEKNIPLLLSRESMKKGRMKLDFENDRGQLFGQEISLKTTQKGHYILPLTNQLEFMHRFEKGQVESFNLSATKCESEHETAIKLHKVFAHPSEKKLLNLIESAGKKWSENEKLKEEIKLVSKNCEICERFRRPSPRPVVGLTMATKFSVWQWTLSFTMEKYYSTL